MVGPCPHGVMRACAPALGSRRRGDSPPGLGRHLTVQESRLARITTWGLTLDDGRVDALPAGDLA